MIPIFRKPGWELNKSDKIVNAILTRCEKNEGKCPCIHPENDGDLQCPCSSYRDKDNCICGLYVKYEEKQRYYD